MILQVMLVGLVAYLIIDEAEINSYKQRNSTDTYLFHMALPDALHSIPISRLCLLVRQIIASSSLE